MQLFTVLFTFIALIAQPLCGQRYVVQTTPDLSEENQVYQMQVGEIATFILTALNQDHDDDLSARIKINKTFWTYNKRLLEKVYSDNYSLQLKALKPGTATLEAASFIGNSQDIKQWTIVIIE